MSNCRVHPATRLLVWLVLLIAVQALDGLLLGGLCLLTFFSGRRIVRRGGRLVWRARWVLVSVFVLLAWGVAGEPLWSASVAPTSEGLQLAYTHVGRLFMVLMTLAAFLESMQITDLLAATHLLLKPLRGAGLNPERGVIRLMLVLRYVETLPRPRDWRSLLDDQGPAGSERLELDSQRFRWLDGVIAFALVLVFSYLAVAWWRR